MTPHQAQALEAELRRLAAECTARISTTKTQDLAIMWAAYAAAHERDADLVRDAAKGDQT